MKKVLYILLVLGLIFSLGVAEKISLVRLTLENQSEYRAVFDFTRVEDKLGDYPVKYYLTVEPAGALIGQPNVRVYTMVRGVYNVTLNYCGLEEPTNFVWDLTKRKAYIIPPCNAIIDKPGGDGVFKLSPSLYEPGEEFLYFPEPKLELEYRY